MERKTMTPTTSTRSNVPSSSWNKSLISKGVSAVFQTKRTKCRGTSTNNINRNSQPFNIFLTATLAVVFVLLLTVVEDVESAKFSGYSKMSHRKKAGGGGGDAGVCPKGYMKTQLGKCTKISYNPLPLLFNKPNRWDHVNVNHRPQRQYGPRPTNFAQGHQLQLVGNDYRRVYRNPSFYGNGHQPNIIDTLRRLKRRFLSL